MSREKYINCIEAYVTLIYSAWIRMHSSAIFNDDVLSLSRTPISNGVLHPSSLFPAMVELIQTHTWHGRTSRGMSTLQAALEHHAFCRIFPGERESPLTF